MKPMPPITALALLAVLGLAFTGCEQAGSGDAHAGHDHEGHDHEHEANSDGAEHDDHEHGEEVALPPATIGDLTVQLAQGHGGVKPGQESHLVVKLPYTDSGASIVRAWIGTEDRTLSTVGKGEYAASHDDYDIHAVAPDPLPENTLWWIEIEKPDGTKVLGSAAPNME